MLLRPVAGVLASCLATLSVYPLDTWKARSLVHTNATGNVYAGVHLSLASRATGTAVFMSVYETALAAHVPTATSAALASMSSTVPVCLFDVAKKERQTRRPRSVAMTRRRMAGLYVLHASSHMPRSVVYYFLYERMMPTFMELGLTAAASGACAAMISSSVAVLLLFPLERLRMLFIFGREASRASPLRARLLSVLQTLASTTVGHAILEALAPRAR